MLANQLQLLVPNQLKIFLSIILVLFLGGPAFSQDDLESDINSLEAEDVSFDIYVDDNGRATEEKPTPKKIDVNSELAKAGLDKAKLKAMMVELKKIDPEGFAKMERGELTPAQSNQMMKEAMKKLPPKTVMKMMGGANNMIKNQLSKVSEGLNAVPYETALANIKTQVDQSKAAPLFKMIPKSHEFLTHFLRDSEASSKFFGIIKDRKRLITFAAINIFLFFIGWRLKARRKKMNYSAGEAFSKGMRQFIFMNAIKLGVIWYFFSAELKPVWGVIQRTYS